jgi:23S rRNA pseudouridine1911/1915/1917 synthase
VNTETSNALTVVITADTSNMRLDRALAHHSDIRTRSRAHKLLSSGLVSYSGKQVKPSRITVEGEVYNVLLPKESSILEPYNIPLDIRYEDEFLLVVNKPAGLVVHPAEGHRQDTLVNALVHHTKDLSMGFGEKRPGIVHRLDKDTSGLLVIAKNDKCHEHLSLQFKARTVHRIYQALVLSTPSVLSRKIESMIGRHPKHRKRFAVIQTGGKFSSTEYRVVKTYNRLASLLELKLKTGRTHQIRVHMSSLGHAIIADPIYGPSRYDRIFKNTKVLDAIRSLKGIALHAGSLGFVHPDTGKPMMFLADPPDGFLQLKEAFENLES